MRVDFYQLGAEPPERTIPLLAAKARQAGAKLLVVSGDDAQLRAISQALWSEASDQFLANGIAGKGHEARQPILLSQACEAANGARLVVLADGAWRDEAVQFDRALLLFGDGGIEGARATWRQLGERDDVERHFWKQENGRWREGP